MKKIFALLTCLMLCALLTVGVYATEAATTAEAVTEAPALEEIITTEPVTEAPTLEEMITTEPVTEAPAIEWEPPTEDEVEQDVLSWVDHMSAIFGDAQFWQDTKAWIKDNLSTVVGAILAVITTIVGIMAKVKMLPEIKAKFQSLGVAIGQWYNENNKEVGDMREALNALKTLLLNFFKEEIKPMVENIERQSAEVQRLEEENAYLRQEYIEARAQSNRIEAALLEYTKLAAEEFYNIIQMSDLSKEERNRHYEAYRQKVAAIEGAIAAKEGVIERGDINEAQS